MVEAVARAIFEKRQYNHPNGMTPRWDEQPPLCRAPFLRDAESAIEAVREYLDGDFFSG